MVMNINNSIVYIVIRMHLFASAAKPSGATHALFELFHHEDIWGINLDELDGSTEMKWQCSLFPAQAGRLGLPV
jgi:hypothetical protein